MLEGRGGGGGANDLTARRGKRGEVDELGGGRAVEVMGEVEALEERPMVDEEEDGGCCGREKPLPRGGRMGAEGLARGEGCREPGEGAEAVEEEKEERWKGDFAAAAEDDAELGGGGAQEVGGGREGCRGGAA